MTTRSPRLSDRQILAFKHVMECGTVSKAAQRMNTVQPGVTRLLRQLEEDLGFELFERVRGRLHPTPEARIFHREVERAWIGLEQLRTTATRIRDRELGALRICAMPMLGLTFLPDLAGEFLDLHPRASLQLGNYRSAQVIEEVLTQRCDLGFAILEQREERCELRRFALPCLCMMPAGHRLAALAEVPLAALAEENLITFERNDPLQRRLDRLRDTAEPSTPARLEVSLTLQAIRLVSQGHGIALVDPINAALSPHPEVITRPLAEDLGLEFALLSSRDQPMSRLARDFVAMFEQRYATVIGHAG